MLLTDVEEWFSFVKMQESVRADTRLDATKGESQDKVLFRYSENLTRILPLEFDIPMGENTSRLFNEFFDIIENFKFQKVDAIEEANMVIQSLINCRYGNQLQVFNRIMSLAEYKNLMEQINFELEQAFSPSFFKQLLQLHELELQFETEMKKHNKLNLDFDTSRLREERKRLSLLVDELDNRIEEAYFWSGSKGFSNELLHFLQYDNRTHVNPFFFKSGDYNNNMEPEVHYTIEELDDTIDLLQNERKRMLRAEYGNIDVRQARYVLGLLDGKFKNEKLLKQVNKALLDRD